MDESTTQHESLATPVMSRPRRPRADMATMRAMVTSWRASGQQLTDFCQERGLAKSVFYRWRKVVEQAAGGPATAPVARRASNEVGHFVALTPTATKLAAAHSAPDHADARWQLPGGLGAIAAPPAALAELLRHFLPGAG